MASSGITLTFFSKRTRKKKKIFDTLRNWILFGLFELKIFSINECFSLSLETVSKLEELHAIVTVKHVMIFLF